MWGPLGSGAPRIITTFTPLATALVLLESTLRSCKHLHLPKVSAEVGMCVCVTVLLFDLWGVLNYVPEELTVPRVSRPPAYYEYELWFCRNECGFMACQLLDLLRTREHWLKIINSVNLRFLNISHFYHYEFLPWISHLLHIKKNYNK